MLHSSSIEKLKITYELYGVIRCCRGRSNLRISVGQYQAYVKRAAAILKVQKRL